LGDKGVRRLLSESRDVDAFLIFRLALFAAFAITIGARPIFMRREIIVGVVIVVVVVVRGTHTTSLAAPLASSGVVIVGLGTRNQDLVV
jgi:hypothetical protein